MDFNAGGRAVGGMVEWGLRVVVMNVEQVRLPGLPERKVLSNKPIDPCTTAEAKLLPHQIQYWIQCRMNFFGPPSSTHQRGPSSSGPVKPRCEEQ